MFTGHDLGKYYEYFIPKQILFDKIYTDFFAIKPAPAFGIIPIFSIFFQIEATKIPK